MSDSDVVLHDLKGPAFWITINRPERRNAFTPVTVKEMINALDNARDDDKIGVIILQGPHHSAQKSTSISDESTCNTSFSKEASLRVIMEELFMVVTYLTSKKIFDKLFMLRGYNVNARSIP